MLINETTEVSSKNRFELSRFAKFVLVGISGTILDYAVLFLLKSLGFSTIIANSCSFSIGMINNYYWNRTWTFSSPSPDLFGRQFFQFLIVSLIGLAINNLVLISLKAPLIFAFNNQIMGFTAAKIMATGVAFFWNYIANRS